MMADGRTSVGGGAEGVASSSASFVSGPKEVATGKVAVLLICACDGLGVPINHGGDPFIASVHGPAACRTEIRDLLDGRYELHVATPSVSGDFRVAVSLRGRAIGGSPHALKVLAPVAHHAHCEASGRALELATAGEAQSFELVAHDAHGRRMTYGGEQYSLRLTRLGGLAETPQEEKRRREVEAAKLRAAASGGRRSGRRRRRRRRRRREAAKEEKGPTAPPGSRTERSLAESRTGATAVTSARMSWPTLGATPWRCTASNRAR